ncbi:hypothetical protein NP493_755g02077 [Ridgeia piscesae]|uniref:Uncharacterized protein n=1 Tax=Ridgeia piscesae TaxID=27915 RepID=A0AAD9KQW7_RIDPI|nr:hypothetical protein NP493_755g02077 [Ridgeia piscesae]
MSKNVVSFAKEKLGTIPQPYDITAIHDLSPRRDGTRPVIVQLLSAEKKATLMNKRGSLRVPQQFKHWHHCHDPGQHRHDPGHEFSSLLVELGKAMVDEEVDLGHVFLLCALQMQRQSKA